MKSKTKLILKRIIIVLISAVILLFGGFYIYTLNYYRADSEAIEAITISEGRVERKGSLRIFYPEKEEEKSTAFIFYPGGKVEASAYAPLLKSLAQKGVLCILVEMPFNLAVLNQNAANGVFDKFPEVKSWFIGGHSLGGAMASSYVINYSSRIKGLVLLGAYPVKTASVPTVAIYGSKDGLLDKSKLKDVKNTIVIAGGNHAYFGNYGEQEGDGAAEITRMKQQEETVKLINEFISFKNAK